MQAFAQAAAQVAGRAGEEDAFEWFRHRPSRVAARRFALEKAVARPGILTFTGRARRLACGGERKHAGTRRASHTDALAARRLCARPDARPDHGRWLAGGRHARTMAGRRSACSVDVHFAAVPATPLGGPGFYVARAGFWHGGAGVAACWFGAAASLADALRRRVKGQGDPHRLAQLGEVSIALQASAALMREAAAAIDRAPSADAMALALSVRLSVEAAATATLAAVGRALGPGPMCKDAEMARRCADLPVFMRQSHAERDLEALGRSIAGSDDGDAPWTL
jgi:hypothetical protein